MSRPHDDRNGSGARGTADSVAVSVVIPTHGEATGLRDALGDVLAQEVSSGQMEVIVVDNNTDERISAEIRRVVSRKPIRLVHASEPGPAAARNAGARHATGRTLLFLDDDVRIEPGFVDAHLAQHASEEDVVVIGAVVERNQSSPWFRRYLSERRVINRQIDPEHLGHYNVYGANSSVSRLSFERVGGFDEAFKRREDADLAIRLLRDGAVLRFAPSASVFHYSDFGLTDHLRRSRSNGYYLAMLISKHPEAPHHERLELMSPWVRWLSAAFAPFAVVAGLLAYPLTPRLFHKGLAAATLVQNSRGFADFRKRNR